jgi:hypothetical protein
MTLLACMACCIVMIGCGRGPFGTSGKGQPEQEPVKPPRIYAMEMILPGNMPNLYEYTIDGHVYLSLRYTHAGTLIHHAGCPCMTNTHVTPRN